MAGIVALGSHRANVLIAIDEMAAPVRLCTFNKQAT